LLKPWRNTDYLARKSIKIQTPNGYLRKPFFWTQGNNPFLIGWGRPVSYTAQKASLPLLTASLNSRLSGYLDDYFLPSLPPGEYFYYDFRAGYLKNAPG